MFNVLRNNTISLTRGNSATINITMENSSTQEYITLGDHDKVVLTAKGPSGEKVIQKTITSDDLVSGADIPMYSCGFEPSDTINLKEGQYRYDVMLLLEDGQVVTFISANLLIAEAIGLYTDVPLESGGYSG